MINIFSWFSFVISYCIFCSYSFHYTQYICLILIEWNINVYELYKSYTGQNGITSYRITWLLCLFTLHVVICFIYLDLLYSLNIHDIVYNINYIYITYLLIYVSRYLSQNSVSKLEVQKYSAIVHFANIITHSSTCECKI